MKENESDSKSAPVLNLSDKEKKEIIINNYLPNLSQYQIIIKKVKDEQIELHPNVNFTDQKDYFIFYNDNLMNLTDLYKKEFKRFLEIHNVILYFKKNNLEESINSGNLNLEADKDISLFKFISKVISGNYKEEIEYANNLVININKLINIRKEFSDTITFEKMCTVTVSEKLFDGIIKVKKYIKNSNEPVKHDYLAYIKEIEDIKNAKLEDNIEKVKLLDEKINILKKEISPENSVDDMNDFCFILNIISNYLRNLERSFESKELQFLEKMDYLRRKIDYYLLEFRFKFVENQAPILNVKIPRYKILCNSDEMTSIFLEKGQIKNFIKNLRTELDNKGKNIDSKYQFKDIELNEFIEIAQKINFEKQEDLINSYEKKIYDLKDQIKQKKLEFSTDISKKLSSGIIDLTFNNNFSKINIIKNGITTSLSEDKIKEFLNCDNKLKEKQKKVKKNKSHEASEEKKTENYNNSNTKNEEEKNKDKKVNEKIKEEKEEKTEEKKDKKKVDEEKKEDKKEEDEEKKENENEKNNENKINESNEKMKENTNEEYNKIMEKRKQNLNSLGIDPKNLTNEVIDNISKSFQMLIDFNKIKRSISENENKINQLKNNLKYNLDFFNALKLFCYIQKVKEKNDIYGIILEEKRNLVKQKSNGKTFNKEIESIREYKINEINNNI